MILGVSFYEICNGLHAEWIRKIAMGAMANYQIHFQSKVLNGFRSWPLGPNNPWNPWGPGPGALQGLDPGSSLLAADLRTNTSWKKVMCHMLKSYVSWSFSEG